MITLTLVQGVVNTFVMFLARVVGYAIDRVVLKNDSSSPGIGYSITVLVLDIVFGLLASVIVAWVSRQREFRADAGAAALMGSPEAMVSALRVLGGMGQSQLPSNMRAFGIAGGGVRKLFSTHPPIPERIEALRSAQR